MKKQIYVVTYKPFQMLESTDSMYIPIVAGASKRDKSEYDATYIMDDLGENISDKNDTYSEFTAVYWIWKHADCDIIGENHYRRYFISGGWIRYIITLFSNKIKHRSVLKSEDVNKIFSEGYDCILPPKLGSASMNMKELYSLYHRDVLLNDSLNVIEKIYPDYIDDFHQCMNSSWFYCKCIFIMKRSKFNEYCQWLFSILKDIEEKNSDLGWRELAFLSERLMTVWIEHQIRVNKFKVKECFYVMTELSFKEQIDKGEILFPRWTKNFAKPFICFLKLMKIKRYK